MEEISPPWGSRGREWLGLSGRGGTGSVGSMLLGAGRRMTNICSPEIFHLFSAPLGAEQPSAGVDHLSPGSLSVLLAHEGRRRSRREDDVLGSMPLITSTGVPGSP